METVQLKNEKICLNGSLHCPGPFEYHDPTRAEMSGFYGIATIIYIIHQVYPEIMGSFTIGCNSESAMHKLLPTT